MKASMLVIAATLLALQPVQSKEEYCALIPNANNVADCALLGHPTSSGRTGENSFGKAFANAGKKWTASLCQADSDGDGQTNGQELGDPCCEWTTSNGKVRYSSGLSNPGDKSETVDDSLWKEINCSNLTSISATTTTTGGAQSLFINTGVLMVGAAMGLVVALP